MRNCTCIYMYVCIHVHCQHKEDKLCCNSYYICVGLSAILSGIYLTTNELPNHIIIQHEGKGHNTNVP